MSKEITVNCPLCNEEITVEITHDSDGDGVWATPVTFGGIAEKHCDCILSQTQEDELLRDAVESEADDIDYY